MTLLRNCREKRWAGAQRPGDLYCSLVATLSVCLSIGLSRLYTGVSESNLSLDD